MRQIQIKTASRLAVAGGEVVVVAVAVVADFIKDRKITVFLF